MKEDKIRTNGHYDTIAPGYLDLYGEEQISKLEIIRDRLNLRKDEIILDVGCGICLSKDVFQCRVVGLDPSRKMLVHAKNSERATNERRGDYIQAMAEQLPFKNGVFDAVISVTAIHNFDMPERGLEEMKRTRKGQVAITIMKKAKEREKLKKIVESNFKIIEMIEEEKDLIMVCDPK